MIIERKYMACNATEKKNQGRTWRPSQVMRAFKDSIKIKVSKEFELLVIVTVSRYTQATQKNWRI